MFKMWYSVKISAIITLQIIVIFAPFIFLNFTKAIANTVQSVVRLVSVTTSSVLYPIFDKNKGKTIIIEHNIFIIKQNIFLKDII